MILDSEQQEKSQNSQRPNTTTINQQRLRQIEALERLEQEKQDKHNLLKPLDRQRVDKLARESESEDVNEQEEGAFKNLAPIQIDQQKKKGRQNQRQNYFLQKLPQPHGPSFQSEVIANIAEKEMALAKESRPRLIIDKIILQNFKSYAGRQEIGPFHENFTSIVGPNGSGKSNLIESMLFIFGYNAAWMRLNRLNQLIHNSASMRNVAKASVQVTFRKVIDINEFETAPVPNSQFTLRRVINANSQSKYYIDDRESTQTEVKQKLFECGIDLQNNRFLILQGEVQTISQMKQKSGDRDHPGLLEYLEQIIGSNQFVDQINVCNEEYGQGEQKKHEKGQLMKMVEGDLKGMNKGKEEAIRFVKTEKRVFQCENILRQVVRKKNENQLRQEQDKLEQLEKDRDRIIAEEKQRMKVQAERVKELKKNKDERLAIEKCLQLEKENLNKQNMKDKNLSQEMSFKSEDIVKYQRRLAQLGSERQKIIDESEVYRGDLPKRREELEKKIEQYQQIRAELSKYDDPQLKERIKQTEAEMRRNNIQMQTMDEKYQAISKKLNRMKQETTDYTSRVKILEEKRKSEQTLMEKLREADKTMKRMHQRAVDQITAKKRERQALKEEVQKVDMSLREFESENNQKSELNNMFTEIMKLKIPGVIGRLGDLGRTTKEFDEIITTACNRLDNIVVKNYDAARSVIDVLKQKRMGRLSCIILDKIVEYGNFMRRSFQPLKNAVRLFDMIETNSDEAKMAFYFALQDTLYCENSELGMEYSMRDDYYRRRVISRKQNGGFIIYQTSGLMMSAVSKRGGFENKGTVKVSTKNSESHTQEIKQLQEKRIQLLESITAIDRIISEKEKERMNIESDSAQSESEKRQIQRNLSELNEEIKQCTRYLQRQNEKSQRASETKDKLQLQSTSIVSRIKVLMAKDEQLKEVIQKLEEQQRKKQSGRVTELRQNYKKLKKQYEKLQKEIEKGQAILDSTESRIKANETQTGELAKKIGRLQADVAKLVEQQRIIEQKATEIFETIAREEQKLVQVKETEKKLRIILDQDEKQVRESKKKIQKAKQDVQFCVSECKRQQQNVDNANNLLVELRKNYSEIIKEYAFLEDIEQIQRMQVFNKNNDGPSLLPTRDQIRAHEHNSSVLDTTVLNTSMDSASKNFPADKMWQTEVSEELEHHQLDTFVLFEEKIRLGLKDQKEALGKLESQNLSIIVEFKTKFNDYKLKYDDYEKIRVHQLELRAKIDKLKTERLNLFRHGFGIINAKLKEVYQLLTRGGDAELELIDCLDPFSDGINFSVRPPKKSWKEINKLSGGQKTLSSLSLIFALHYYKPTPLYFMDQIDAALDFKNVSIVADYIKKRTKNAQFIIISLRNHMFDLADKLVGVYKTFDKTKTILFRPSKYIEKKKQAMENGRVKKLGKENDSGNLVNVEERVENQQQEDLQVRRASRA